jgi:hypothetical protein
VTSAVADIWGHRQAQVYIEVTVLAESRRRTCKLSGVSRRLGGRAVKDGGDTRRVAGDAYGVCYS